MATMPGELMTRHRLTVDDYHQMAESGILGPDDRVELIAGEVLDMSPIGSLHAALVRALARWLTDSVALTCLALPGATTTLAAALPLGRPEGAGRDQ